MTMKLSLKKIRVDGRHSIGMLLCRSIHRCFLPFMLYLKDFTTLTTTTVGPFAIFPDDIQRNNITESLFCFFQVTMFLILQVPEL